MNVRISGATGGRPAAGEPDLVQAQQEPDLGQHLLISPLVGLRQRGGHLPRLGGVHVLVRDTERLLGRLPLGRVGLGGRQGLDACLQLLPRPRHPAEDRRAGVGQRTGQRRDVGDRGDLHAGEHGAVVAEGTLGGVRHRQVGDDAVFHTGRPHQSQSPRR